MGAPDMHPKVAAATVAGAATILIVWGLGFANVTVPPEVASAFTTLAGLAIGYLVPSPGPGA